ncbi:hypothetical protein E5554_16125 [Sphingobium sp. PAMC28499]|uniref:hypothetical protein n=1 Tax=Sphingobium sp. PAMC28499 TaxID=2565554 RepID=UPI00109DE6A4|nr:hypothetical protein [Sphingobium sp. PAMC28499]QCB39221.1 hypothetical protein E5554_16125 [Sphingobium sp. PAMC28499]
MSGPNLNAPPQISDWPEAYVAELREDELADLSDRTVLARLKRDHGFMRFGRYIDLNVQQGFYLHPGNGVIDKEAGTDSGFVIGALGGLGITVDANGQADWFQSEVEQHYVKDGCAKLSWVLANAKGPWFLTADLEEGRHDDWYWLVLRFLHEGDESAFLAAFPGGAA